MKKSIWLFILLSPFGMFAQPGSMASIADSLKNAEIERILTAGSIESFLPPLSLLIDSALAHSPEMMNYDANIRAREYEVALEEKAWWSSLEVGGQFNYGTFGNQILDNIALGQQFSFLVKMPFSTWVGRSERINKAKSFLDADFANREAARRQVANNVVALYNTLLVVRRKLVIIGEGKEMGALIKESAEMSFRKGDFTLDQLNITMDFWVRQTTAYEDLRAEFATTYFALEQIVGVPFSKFEKY